MTRFRARLALEVGTHQLLDPAERGFPVSCVQRPKTFPSGGQKAEAGKGDKRKNKTQNKINLSFKKRHLVCGGRDRKSTRVLGLLCPDFSCFIIKFWKTRRGPNTLQATFAGRSAVPWPKGDGGGHCRGIRSGGGLWAKAASEVAPAPLALTPAQLREVPEAYARCPKGGWRGRCLCKTFSTRRRSPSRASQSDLRNRCHGSPAICCWLLGCACLRPSAFHSPGTIARHSAVALLPALGLVAQLGERLWPHAQVRHRFWAGRRGPACGPPLCAPASRAERAGRGRARGRRSRLGRWRGLWFSAVPRLCPGSPCRGPGPGPGRGGGVPHFPLASLGGGWSRRGRSSCGERGAGRRRRGAGTRPPPALRRCSPREWRSGRASRRPRRPGARSPPTPPAPPSLRPAPPLMARTSVGRRLPSSRARRPRGTPRSPPPPRPRQPCSPQPAARTRSRRNRRGRRRAANNDRGWRAAAGVDPAAAATCASPRGRGPGCGPSWLRGPRGRSRP